MKKILILHGPNLNLLGLREPHIYGETSLEHINQQLLAVAQSQNIHLRIHQSNSESTLVEHIHQASLDAFDGLIANFAAFTHTSIALRDAILATAMPLVEVHLSQVGRRETFRQHSYFSDIAQGVISGFGPKGYLLALTGMMNPLTQLINQ